MELMNPKVTINVFLQSYFHIEIAGKVEVEHINQKVIDFYCGIENTSYLQILFYFSDSICVMWPHGLVLLND